MFKYPLINTQMGAHVLHAGSPFATPVTVPVCLTTSPNIIILIFEVKLKSHKSAEFKKKKKHNKNCE